MAISRFGNTQKNSNLVFNGKPVVQLESPKAKPMANFTKGELKERHQDVRPGDNIDGQKVKAVVRELTSTIFLLENGKYIQVEIDMSIKLMDI